MRNYLSFSLYGDDPKYVIGGVKNMELLPEIYPGWKAVYYIGKSVPANAIARLTELGALVVQTDYPETPSAMLWRYQAIFIEDVENVIFRDTDSRISMREARLVNQWLESRKDIHIVRDHPNHTSAILGGLWGCKASSLRGKLQDLDFFILNSKARYGFDQEVLRSRVYRSRHLSRLIHDGFFVRELSSSAPPRHDDDGSFLGEVFSEDDVPDKKAREQVRNYWNSATYRFRTQLRSLRTMAYDSGLDFVRPTPVRKPIVT